VAAIDTILLDFGGTLDVPGGHWLDRFLRHYQAAGWRLSRDELDRAFAHATALGYRTGRTAWQWDLERLVDHLVTWQIAYLRAFLPERCPPGEILATAIAAPFCAESRSGLARSRAILEPLAAEYRIGVVSNFYGNLEAVLQDAGLLPMVSAVVDSSQVGVFKPDPEIYRIALRRLGASADRTLMVGDSLDKDCAPARLLGMATAWLTTQDNTSIDGRTDYLVHGLEELIPLCERANSRSHISRRAG
jgi:FMN phosphatase YigB (HAD superfamily)